ncbi:hypothetical protein [Moorena sp. SIO4G3]|uniref:hypothetical protein n=1 Tax=Moorena sp. SIO4G3 TaxID=2607821 RepID=UPI00142C77E8|nr:hypothetical protein [Moorena sp. SIO4G3]NEO76236.1 hypothetical protein [Moorena sp. SIO4G3]
MAKRPRNPVQPLKPWPKGHAIPFNLKPSTLNLGLWPRFANNLQPSTSSTFNLQPSTFNL